MSCALALGGGALLMSRPGPPQALMPVVPPAPVLHTLHITSEPPGVEVRVGDTSRGTTPLELRLPQGMSVDLTLQGSGLEPVRYTHLVTGAAQLPFKLQPKKATLTLKTRPPKATVLRDGQPLGETPLRFTGDAEVPVKLVLQLKGHARREIEIVPRDGAELEFELARPSVRDDSPFNKTKDQR